jgi:hypothetical protein
VPDHTSHHGRRCRSDSTDDAAQAVFSQLPAAAAPAWTSEELQHVYPEVAPHPRPRALDLTSVLDDAAVVADEVRLRLNRRHDERHVGLGERVAE